MHSQGAHIITRCQWDTAFDSKNLAHQLQMDISAWSAYKMKRIINRVFDSICPQGQTLKIRKLAVDLGSITYENMLSELPLRLEEALRNALYDLIMYPKNGDKTLEIVHEDIAQINVLRDFLVQGMLPWNYQEAYGTAIQIMRSQLTNNRLSVIQMIQEIGISQNVRKRIAWQFPDAVLRKIIAGLEPNNHQQILSFSDEFVKVQEKETIVQTSTNDLKKNIWLWILNYLFTERGTIFNRIAFVKSTVEQMASHFNISYDAMIELIEEAIERANEYSQVDKGLMAILKLLAEELHNTSFSRVKTEKQKENFWGKVETYFNTASARSTNIQKNEFNELVINLSKLDATRFQKIILKVAQKPTVWKAILKDLIPAAIERLFLALSPSLSKNILSQISFLSKLPQTNQVKVDVLDLYTFGITFCIAHQNTSVTKSTFLDFIIEKLAKQQQQSKLVILDHFVAANLSKTQKKTSFISLFKELHTLYQKEIINTKTYTSETALQQIIAHYVAEIEQKTSTENTLQDLEKTLQKWMAASPIKFWNRVQQIEKTSKVSIHIAALVAAYGTARFIKAIQPETYTLLTKIQRIIETLISKQPKKASALRAIKNILVVSGFEVLWKYPKTIASVFFAQLLQNLEQQENIVRISKTNIQEVIQLILKTQEIRTLSWSAREFVAVEKQYKKYSSQTPLEQILSLVQKSNQQAEVAKHISKLVRAKKITTSEFKANEATIIAYLVSNGVEIRKRMLATFYTQITNTKTSFNTIQIKTMLQELFWQSLVAYQTHRGNERSFVLLFEKMVAQTFPTVKTTLKKVAKPTVKTKKVAAEIQTLQIPYRISVVALFEAVQAHLKTTNTEFKIAKKTYTFSEIIALGLETSPAKIRAIIQETAITETQIRFLKDTIKFETFIVFHANDASSAQSEAFKAMHTLFNIVKQLGNAKIVKALQAIFWKQTIALIQGKTTAKKSIEFLVKTAFDALSEITTLDQITIVKHIQNNNIHIPLILKTVLVERHRVFELITEQKQDIALSEAIKKYTATEKIEELSKHLLTHYEIPAWFLHTQSYTYERVVNELVAQQPLIILKTIRSQHISEVQLIKFVQTIHFETFIAALLKLYSAQQKELLNIRKLYETIAFVSMRGISTKSLQQIIIKKVVTAWQTSNWSLIASTNIWNELLWETCGKKAVQKQDFYAAINSIKTMLPTALLVTYKSLVSQDTSSKNAPQNIENTITNTSVMESTKNTFPAEGVPIMNAGLVMLNSYFLMLLERLGAAKDNAFVSAEAQMNAVHYLQFIVTGQTETEESLLTLNKILTGLSPNTPVKDSVEMTQDQKDLINGMIQAAISYWPAIGQTSTNGFRGNWLVRDGILRETEERWELTVEKRPYDVLMLKSPFSFSIIKLPWMEKPLHVTWPF
ncbi:contractile injection system tape measure protein [uncultured Kordia sp.]|uniref:contractile injection system tape measure protein n=1 Tax=uncultured Kordia sp. TaxID=507699 RepID=UPI00262B83CA|nr:contractile injection system tape measure protein [uncultured Kordia sp.]